MKVNDVTVLIVLQHISRYGIYCNAECLFMATDIPMSILSHPFIVKDDGQKTINQMLVNIFFGGQGAGICIVEERMCEAEVKKSASLIVMPI